MTTKWFLPNTITQTAEIVQHVAWREENNFANLKTLDANYISTTRELLHIANNSVNDLKMKTYYLYLTDFNIVGLPDTISGIEVEIDMKRGGRITDETIQLRYNNEFIGVNRADYKLDNYKLFGGATDRWELETIDATMLTDSNFGLGLRFQSHPAWPHREHPMINYIRLRVS